MKHRKSPPSTEHPQDADKSSPITDATAILSGNNSATPEPVALTPSEELPKEVDSSPTEDTPVTTKTSCGNDSECSDTSATPEYIELQVREDFMCMF